MSVTASFEEWQATAPDALLLDPLWRMKAYRLAAFVAEAAAEDARELALAPAFVAVADQLARAAGSIGANIAEGYSRGSGRDRVRLFEYALGSVRETVHWYQVAGRQLRCDLSGRIAALVEIRRLLLAIIPKERGRQISG